MCVAVVGSLPADGMRSTGSTISLTPTVKQPFTQPNWRGMDIGVMCCETRMSSRSEFEDLGWIADTMDRLSQS